MADTWYSRDLKWYEEEKARVGARAAFAGLQFATGTRPAWFAVAVGDSCVFQERGSVLVTSVPLKDAAEFNNYPPLIPSRLDGGSEWARAIIVAAGSSSPGDVFWLMTDAMAKWYLDTWPTHAALRWELNCVAAAPTTGSWLSLVRRERRLGRLHDDDVAAIRIYIESNV